MKKLFIILAVAGTLVACNNNADGTANAKDSLDSVAQAKKEKIDSSAEVRKDVIDSTTEQKKEALNRLDSLNKRDSVAPR